MGIRALSPVADRVEDSIRDERVDRKSTRPSLTKHEITSFQRGLPVKAKLAVVRIRRVHVLLFEACLRFKYNTTPEIEGEISPRTKCSSLGFKCNSLLHLNRGFPRSAVYDFKYSATTTFKHEKFVNGALFNRDESCILTWSEDGAVRLWNISSVDEKSSDEGILDFQVRTGTSLRGSVELTVLTFEECLDKKRALEAIRENDQSTK